MKIAAALLLALPFAAAECPNACSGSGECSMNDMCDCHAGFQGGDCSERVCQYNFAFVTTSNGDVNFDGDRYDGTVYTADTRINANHPAASVNSGGSVLLTQAAPGGTWENWPSYTKQNEGHFYMECSNRGLCKRDTGDCECFPGYEGVACNRMACPDNCNGKGVCQTVKDFSSSYNKWDGDMARSCKCDPGYAGISCAERQCPFSNDVLTKTNELVESQFVEIFTTCETITAHRTALGAACANDLELDANSALLAGTFTLKFTDHYGQEYTTDPIDLDMGPAQPTSTSVATKTQAALRALPNDVTSDTVTVTASTCGVAVDSQVATMSATGDVSGEAQWAAADYFALAADGVEDIYKTATPGKLLVTKAGTQFADASGIATSAVQLVRYTTPICVRLKITFNDMPGNIAALVVDTDSVTYDGFTNAMYPHTPASDNHVGSEVFDGDNKLAVTGGYHAPAANTNLADIAYNKPSLVTHSASASTSAKVLTLDVAAFTDTLSTATTFYPESVVEVKCTESSVLRSLGFYTIASITKIAMTFKETIATSECGASAAVMTVTQISNVIAFGTAAYTAAASEATGVPDVTAVHAIIAGESRVAIKIFGVAGVKQFDSTVASKHHAVLTTDGLLAADAAVIKRSWLILTDDSTKTSPDAITAAKAFLQLDSDGTMENAECGDRGMCDTDSGLCKCFTGYTGDACQLQKAISA